MTKHIYGIHDSGSWRDYIEQAGVSAWAVEPVAIGCDPNDKIGQSFGVRLAIALIDDDNICSDVVASIGLPYGHHIL